jgi:hypothetical protein
MNEKELKENISKIEKLFESGTPEAAFELLKTINNPELNEALADSIQRIVNEKYFEGKSEQQIVNEGLDILKQLLPKITTLSMVDCYMESLDISNFSELESIDLSGCDCLEEIKGLNGLSKLNNLDLSYTSSLKLDTNDYSHIKNIKGLRNKYGMVSNEYKKEYFWNHLWRVIEDKIQELVDDCSDEEEYEDGLNEYLGSSIIITIDESDFYDESFDSSSEYFEPLESALSKEQMEYLPKIGKDYQEDEIAVFLFTSGWDFITSFYRPKDDLPGADEF